MNIKQTSFSHADFPLSMKLVIFFGALLIAIIFFIIWRFKTRPLLKKKSTDTNEPLLLKTLNIMCFIAIPTFIAVGLIFLIVL